MKRSPLLIVCAFAVLVPSGFASAQQASKSQSTALRQYLQHEFKNDNVDGTVYSAALVDLNGDGKPEAIVYLSGPGWCGSGGCGMLVLTPQGNSYREITSTTITRPPIRVLQSKT